jgi:hypothetical protein
MQFPVATTPTDLKAAVEWYRVPANGLSRLHSRGKCGRFKPGMTATR